jgi:chaperonin GroES
LATASATSLQLKPLADRVVVRKLEAEEKTAGGIVLPDTAKEKPQQGEVLAVGPGRVDDKGTRIPMEVKKGDKVLFAKYSGTEVKYEGVEYLILAERDLLAIIG